MSDGGILKILVIGGTAFLGRTFVSIAAERGHELTLFKRGQRNPGVFPDIEHIQGDRAADMDKLAGRSWDAVLDTCGYFPRIVRMSAEALKDSVGRYCFISSISVYTDLSSPPSEETPVGKIEDETFEEITGENYGPLKALCEDAIREVFGDRTLIVRPGLIVGPYDPSDRFTYWPLRFARGGDVLVPDQKQQPVQVIDVRDLAAWILSLFEHGISGTFNATGPVEPLSLEEFLTLGVPAIGEECRFVWVDPAFLEEQKVEPWSDLPVVLPFDGESWNMSLSNIDRALETGLTFRPLSETYCDTLAWARERGEVVMKAGLTQEREAELLATWRTR